MEKSNLNNVEDLLENLELSQQQDEEKSCNIFHCIIGYLGFS